MIKDNNEVHTREEMPDREKVMQAIRRCIYDPDPGQTMKEIISCSECPYCHGCTRDLMRDAIDLLKEQEARVMTLEEVKKQRPDEDTDDNWVWMEFNGGCCRMVHIHEYHELKCAEYPDGYRSLKYAHTAWAGDTRYRQLYYNHANCDTYNKTWRCWTSRPTDEQRKAVAWEPPKEDDDA